MIYLGTDHAGFNLKEVLKKYLSELGYEIKDLGNFVYDEADDYPDWIGPCAEAVANDLKQGIDSRGIILGGSGQGEAIVANKVSGIRATVLYNYNEDIIRLSRQHNNANVLSLGARFIDEEQAKKAVELWLETDFPGDERHIRRIAKI
ncbi:RpiB/LacA/LacB family sugar-phosphate isomerase [Candidatus Azambacteria bacterium]|nr:RpiB/LacA/LacB family sugar-phosphate isomerase [Candidatus Azambacteria bacterium]